MLFSKRIKTNKAMKIVIGTSVMTLMFCCLGCTEAELATFTKAAIQVDSTFNILCANEQKASCLASYERGLIDTNHQLKKQGFPVF